MSNPRKQGIVYSSVLHALLLILLVAGLPVLLDTKRDIEPAAITVEILPITGVTNVKPSETPPAPKEEAKKEPEAVKPAPPVKTAEAPPAPPPPPPEKKEDKPEKKAEEKKPEEKKPEKKMKEEDLLAVLKSVKETAAKEAKKNSKDTESASESKSKSQQYDPSMPLSLSEKDAIKSQLAQCWSPPIGAKDAHGLVVVLKAKYERDGTNISVEMTDATKARAAKDGFYRAAAESALRAVKKPACNPLKNLPADKYEGSNGWGNMELTFDPREMLF